MSSVGSAISDAWKRNTKVLSDSWHGFVENISEGNVGGVINSLGGIEAGLVGTLLSPFGMRNTADTVYKINTFGGAVGQVPNNIFFGGKEAAADGSGNKKATTTETDTIPSVLDKMPHSASVGVKASSRRRRQAVQEDDFFGTSLLGL